jgi:hypothetical protein
MLVTGLACRDQVVRRVGAAVLDLDDVVDLHIAA